MAIEPGAEMTDIKRMPQEMQDRDAIRSSARDLANALEAPSSESLRENGMELLKSLNLSSQYLGFAMVALNNAYWSSAFASAPFSRRLLLLPLCLRSSSACKAVYSNSSLTGPHCSLCPIGDIQAQAESLGYRIVIAEGVTSVSMSALEGDADAVLGVACLDSLEKSFGRIAEWGIPHQAVPLLTNGCADTRADMPELMRIILRREPTPEMSYQTYMPLLRFANRLFERNWIEGNSQPDRIADGWLRMGGKRFRPFVSLAAYAVRAHGLGVLDSRTVLEPLIPESVRKLAVAVEVMHKASLVHDDIQDDDTMRYGRETLHRAHGTPIAINIGDYLIGVGYRLIASASADLGAEAVADIFSWMSKAHVDLCRGQGMELQWTCERPEALSALEVMRWYRQKTAPAFTTALFVGLRGAGPVPDTDHLTQYGAYLGEGYQVLNDLEDWENVDHKGSAGLDAQAMRPTVLFAFAMETTEGLNLSKALREMKGGLPPDEIASIYRKSGVFDKTERLYSKLRLRALSCADAAPDPALSQLFRFIAKAVLPERRLA
jgi:geranylgeranyl diphosphate synthase, type II